MLAERTALASSTHQKPASNLGMQKGMPSVPFYAKLFLMASKFLITRVGTGFKTETEDANLARRFQKNPQFKVRKIDVQIQSAPIPQQDEPSVYPVKPNADKHRKRRTAKGLD